MLIVCQLPEITVLTVDHVQFILDFVRNVRPLHGAARNGYRIIYYFSYETHAHQHSVMFTTYTNYNIVCTASSSYPHDRNKIFPETHLSDHAPFHSFLPHGFLSWMSLVRTPLNLSWIILKHHLATGITDYHLIDN